MSDHHVRLEIWREKYFEKNTPPALNIRVDLVVNRHTDFLDPRHSTNSAEHGS